MSAKATNAPQARHHCPGCGHVTLTPLGQEEVVCGGCGKPVTETRLGLDCLATLLAEREKYGAGDMNATFEMPGAYSPGSCLRASELTNEEIFHRMRQIANRIHHSRQAGLDGED